MKGTKTKAWHIAFLMLADVVSVLLAMLIAYLMTVGDKSFSLWLVWWALGNIACTLLFFGLFGMYGIVFSTVGIIDALKQTLAIVGVASANVIFAVLTGRAYVGISTALVYSIFLFYFSVMTRFFKRILIVVRYYLSRTKVNRKRVMIVGAEPPVPPSLRKCSPRIRFPISPYVSRTMTLSKSGNRSAA